ncbi:phosphotransferase [Nocardioides sp. NPDC051685]|uniref:phosphotransferase n=1 Tax=Nocardioides sp. NPDC051685 TaxID=3364334 RepID=UPI00378F44EA
MSAAAMASDPLAHPRQRNRTRLLNDGSGRPSVLKEYTHMCGEDVRTLSKIERRLRSAGVPMPEMLDWSAEPPATVHAYVNGEHRTDPTSEMIDAAAEVFAKQLKVLPRTSAPWVPRRPVGLPARSREAAHVARSSSLRDAIVGSWYRISELAASQPWTTTHGDWRADNLLYGENAVLAVLDWEILISVPVAEAVGYAAASLTHSWRPDLRKPLDPSTVVTFIHSAERHHALAPGETGHARLAALHVAAVRLAEDEADGIDAPTLSELTRHLGARR